MESMTSRVGVIHIPQRVWQERPNEISWRCSCGTHNKHVHLSGGAADLKCVSEDTNETNASRDRVLRNVGGRLTLSK